jgi:hypothetical protein
MDLTIRRFSFKKMNSEDKKIYNFINGSFGKLKNYCEKERFKGWDPYDGLNSQIFRKSPFNYYKVMRLIWIQVFKKNPINLRPLLFVKKGYNPKGLGLFLSAYCNLYKINKTEDYLISIKFLADTILGLKTNGYSGDCWGYNFDWQSRLEYMPVHTPTIVATSFISYSLIDAYEITAEQKYLESAIRSCEFIIKDLNRTKKQKGFIFSYSPFDKMRVYNASLLGSKILSRVYSYTKNVRLAELAKESIIGCTQAQKENGEWFYGEHRAQRYVDSFHTGYNLESINEYQKYTGDKSFENNIKLGTEYYLNNFFLNDGTPKYYDNKTFPIDIHCPAQFIAALSRLDIFKENIDFAQKILVWTIKNMQDSKLGYFYYQINKHATSKIPYMRWAQAWMFYAMSFYLLETKRNEEINNC